MKICKFYLIVILFFALSTNAQIDKGNWMMGGSGGFSYGKTTGPGYTDSGGTIFYVYPNIGYFFIDKFAVGASVPLSFSKGFNSYGFAPFVRYYFLEKEKPINIFSQISYGINKSTGNFRSDNFNIKAGTVFFLNSSVGLELALNYANQKTSQDFQTNSIYLGVGFQIHLEKK